MNITEDVVLNATKEYLDYSNAHSPRYNPVSAMRNALTVAVNMISEWQPIDSAPKDGTFILLFTPSGIVECRYEDSWEPQGCYSTYDGHGCVALNDTPTHWMPLPTPPKEI